LLVFALIACLVLFFYLAPLRVDHLGEEAGRNVEYHGVHAARPSPALSCRLGVAISSCYALIKDIVRSIRRPDRSDAEGVDK